VQPSQRIGNSNGHAGWPEGIVRHRPGVEPGEHDDVKGRQVVDDGRPGASRRGGTRVVELVAAVHRKELGRLARDPEEVRRAVDSDPVVAVRQPAADRYGGDLPTMPRGHGGEDLVDCRGRRGHGHSLANTARAVAAAAARLQP